MALKLKIKATVKCPRHKQYNPEKDGEGGIKANCAVCRELLEMYRAANDFVAWTKGFGAVPQSQSQPEA